MNTKMILCAGICAIGLSGLAESAPHTKSRDTFYPNENSVVRANPCPFLWPAERQGDYQFKLGRTPDLSGDEVYRETMQWAFAYPGKKLAPGTWYWQVNNQPVQMFQALENPEYSQEIPSFEAIAARMPKSHPRLLLLAGEREAFAARISPELRNEVLDAADLFLKTSLEEIKPPQVDFSRIDDDTVKRLAINDTKKFLGQVQTPIVYLAKAWLLTGDELYGKKCVELTLGVRNLDARLVGLNDFTRSAVQDTLVFAFDSCYDFFDPADRAAIQKTIADGAEKEYAHHVNRLETQLFDNHTWQKTYASLLRSTIALYGHDERADAWLHYTYKLWFARAPASGFNYDGGWHNGTGYLTANFVTLIQVPLLWKRLAGVDAFEHPWYQNAAKSVLATYPPGSYSAGFGDGHSSQTHPHWKRGVFMQMLAREMNDPYAAWYFQTLEKWEHGKKKRVYDAAAKHKLDSEGLEWFVALSDKPMPAAQPPIDLPLARAMPDTGVVSIHTQPAALKDDIHVAFRSSPFGSGSHCLASQNAFNIIAGGKPLFLSSGYYTSFSDPHTLLQYRHSRGHNTILADGIGQSIGNEGYGQIRRFQTLEKISYAMGDASHAYGGELTDSMWIKNFAKSKVAHSRENGFGDAGVTKYQRHILFIHPINTLVVYDDLEGDHPVEWSWLLHSPGEIKQTGQNQFKASNGLFTGHVDVKGSVKTESALTTKFFSPAVNWQKHTAYDGSVRELPDQWHLSVNSAPTVKTRYLAIIQITPADCAPAAVEWNGGVATIGNWIIDGELSSGDASHLSVSEAGETVFDSGDIGIQGIEAFPSR